MNIFRAQKMRVDMYLNKIWKGYNNLVNIIESHFNQIYVLFKIAVSVICVFMMACTWICVYRI